MLDRFKDAQWYIGGDPLSATIYDASDPNGPGHAVVCRHAVIEDARLIAVAPELLQVAYLALELLGGEHSRECSSRGVSATIQYDKGGVTVRYADDGSLLDKRDEEALEEEVDIRCAKGHLSSFFGLDWDEYYCEGCGEDVPHSQWYRPDLAFCICGYEQLSAAIAKVEGRA